MFNITITVRLDPATQGLLKRIADNLDGTTQAEIDKAAGTIGEDTATLKQSEAELSAALAQK